MTDPMQEMQDARDELREVETSLSYHIFRALIGWAIRWTIGFGLIWAITAWTGRFDWLWTAGIIVALISLATILFFRIWFFQKTQATQLKLDQLAQLIEEQEAESGPSPAPGDSLDTIQEHHPENPNGKL